MLRLLARYEVIPLRRNGFESFYRFAASSNISQPSSSSSLVSGEDSGSLVVNEEERAPRGEKLPPFRLRSSKRNQLRKQGFTMDPAAPISDHDSLVEQFSPQAGPDPAIRQHAGGYLIERPAVPVETDRGPISLEFIRLERNKILPVHTDFRLALARRQARRVLPTPLTLKGFSNKSLTNFWTHRSGTASTGKIRRRKDKSNSIDEFWSQFSPSLRLMAENNPEELAAKYPNVYAHYLTAKSLENNHQTLPTKSDMHQPQFPFQSSLVKDPKAVKIINDADQLTKSAQPPSDLMDSDLAHFHSHHHLMQFFATELGGVLKNPVEYDSEVQAWKEAIWRRNYGTPDVTCPPSRTPCGGCGAHLHCVDTRIPGYMPSEKFHALQKNRRLAVSGKCSRCELLEEFNISVNVNVHPHLYPDIISKIRLAKTPPIVIVMVDLLDYPCSIWPGIVNLITGAQAAKRHPSHTPAITSGTNDDKNNNDEDENQQTKGIKIHVVANKVDLLPKDSAAYLDGVKDSLQAALIASGIQTPEASIRSINLISAKTGYGVERLITRLFEDLQKPTDVYLLGCTNVGKSTLFNALLQSDLCALRENDIISRATASHWPGTTLNLLKFPVRRPSGVALDLRRKRLRWESRTVNREDRRVRATMYRTSHNPQYATLVGRIGQTFARKVPFTVESGHPFASAHLNPKPFNPEDRRFAAGNFFYDTPGAIYKDQLLGLLTAEELLLTIPRQMIVPRSFTLRPGQTLFVGGLARVDVEHSRRNVMITAFASQYLPCNVVWTEKADQFYSANLGTDVLRVPLRSSSTTDNVDDQSSSDPLNDPRLKLWPRLRYRRFDISGNDVKKASADICLSSVGWVAVALPAQETCQIRAWTPQGLGIHLRDPPILAYGHHLRGKWIRGTPMFENNSFTYQDLNDSRFREIYESSKHLKFSS